MALSLAPPSQPPSPPRSSRRSAFLLSFLPLTPISSIPSTPGTFSSDSEEWPQQHPSTPESIPGSTTSLSVYSTPLTLPQSPSVLPAWKAVPPTPPAFLPLSPPSHPPVRRRTHPRPASAILSGSRTSAAQRRLSLPARAMRTTTPTSPPSAFRTHERRSSLGIAARRLFHIEGDDATSDDGDDLPVPPVPSGLVHAEEELIPKRSVSERHHALLELLMSERSYLADLRVLVNVYLEQLPMLVSPKVIALPLISPSYSATFAFGRPEETPKDKDRDKDREKRALLSDIELSVVRRNAAHLLELHENVSVMLTDAVRASGWINGLNALEGSGEFGSEPSSADNENDDAEECFESALRSVVTLFTTQAALFNVYEIFCAEHPGAIEVVRSLQRKRPVEWDAFERRCTTLVAANLARAGDPRQGSGSILDLEEENTRSRERLLRADSKWKDEELPHVQRPPTTSLIGKDTKKEKLAERDPRLRLQFMDYLIKPVQRICKYPLLLGALTLERRPQVLMGVDAAVMNAKQAMTDVASLVDNANFSHLQLQQTSRISSRLAAPAGVLAFIRTLSPCTLAGSLDVVRAPALKAKYLAAFLYEGGFLALAKVNRGPRYELRYWFSLEGFELYDAMDDDPLLPYSFRLCNQGHEFEIAASCQREKQVWMHALRVGLAATPTWTLGTAPSSLEPAAVAIEPHSPVDEQGPSLPTIQSIPDIEGSHKQGPPSSPLQQQRPTLRAELSPTRGLSEPPPSRRESTASLKSIFGPIIDPDAVTVTRASPQARAIVDALLEDVFSAACHSARSYAEAHSETLFHVAPTFGAAARFRLTKRESVLVRRRRSYVDLVDQAQAAVRSSRKAHPGKMPLAPLALECITSVEQDGVVPLMQSPEGLFDSPTVISQCSSATGSRGGSSVASPLADALELPPSLPDSYLPSGSDSKSLGPNAEDLLAAREVAPKRSRSLVENFRGFIHSSSSPPVRTLSVSRLSVLPALPPPSTPSQSQRRLWRETLRRRSRSSPYVSADILDPAATAAIARHRAERVVPATLSPSTAAAAALPHTQRYTWNPEEFPEEGSSPLFHSTPSPTRRRSFFGNTTPRVSPATPRNMLRSILASFSRTPSSTSVGQDL
ncbi:hypothetical protein B0F90DRAFT_1814016 [Multifurca ochricompacta]|uniref:DH domain-containing protein n=1 Tax=Multifurca ochricompacta TaxID=376703 RepID=A0AAD4MBA5_9AGAM|nr:hypothetical protein B0F90DRAFT_1814016 [Multifurca ochricompacta]